MRRWLLGALLAALATAGLAVPAFAHDVLVSSTPDTGARLADGPQRVTLTFNAPVQQGPNTITVIGPEGQHWEADDHSRATVNPDGNGVSAAVRPLGPAGTYTIGYRIISADGHPVHGELHFTLTEAGNGSPNQNVATAPGSGADGSGGILVWVWIVVAVVVLGIGMAVALRIGRTPEQRE